MGPSNAIPVARDPSMPAGTMSAASGLSHIYTVDFVDNIIPWIYDGVTYLIFRARFSHLLLSHC